MLDAGSDIESKSNTQRNPLIEAIYSEKEANAKLLIAYGANINVKTPQADSLLQMAIKYDKFNFVKILINCHPLMAIKDQEGKTPMEFAFSEKKMNSMKLMMY